MSKEKIYILQNKVIKETLTKENPIIGFETKNKKFNLAAKKTSEGGKVIILTDIGQVDQHTIEIDLVSGTKVTVKDLNNLQIIAGRSTDQNKLPSHQTLEN